MPEGQGDPPVRRGRRRPELIEQMAEPDELPEVEMDDAQLGDAGISEPDELPVLLPGDIVLAKSSVSLDINGQEAWFTYGVQTRVQPGEDEENTFMRVGAVVNTRVLDLAAAAEEEIGREIERKREEARRQPIRTRRLNH